MLIKLYSLIYILNLLENLEEHVDSTKKAMRDTQVKQDGEKSILYIGTRLTPINHETHSLKLEAKVSK